MEGFWEAGGGQVVSGHNEAVILGNCSARNQAVWLDHTSLPGNTEKILNEGNDRDYAI